GIAAILFGLRAIVPSLRDPYVTNYALPFYRGFAGEAVVGVAPAASVGGSSGLLITLVRWPAPDKPDLEFFVLPGSPSYSGLLGVLPEASNTESTSFNPVASAISQAEAEDSAAKAALRSLFERTATPVRERLLLLDVSSNIDQFGIGFGLSGRD